MKPIIHYYLALCLLLILCGTLQAQTYMKVNLSDGSTEYYDINDIRKLTFENLITSDPGVLAQITKIFNQLKSYPNPASDHLTIEYQLGVSEDISLNIFDINGTLIYRKDLGQMETGFYIFNWDLTNSSGDKVSTGTYICKVFSKRENLSTKLLIVK